MLANHRRRRGAWDARPTLGIGSHLIMAAWGVLWTVGAASAGAPWFFCAFGIVFACLGLGRAFLRVANASPADVGIAPRAARAVPDRCARCRQVARLGAAFCPTCGCRL